MNVSFFKRSKKFRLSQSLHSYKFRDLQLEPDIAADLWFSKHRLIKFIKDVIK